MDINKIPPHILADLRERLSDEEILNSTPEHLFKEYCQWNNLLGWGTSLIYALDSLRAADTEEIPQFEGTREQLDGLSVKGDV